MNRSLYRPLVALLLMTGSVTAGVPGSLEAANCGDAGMMDEKMMDPGMMKDSMMDGPGMMGEPMMAGDAMMDGEAMMGADMMDKTPMMGDMTARARDGQCLASQSAAVQAAFAAAFGDGAGARWVQEHERELTRSGM